MNTRLLARIVGWSLTIGELIKSGKTDPDEIDDFLDRAKARPPNTVDRSKWRDILDHRDDEITSEHKVVEE